jgi:Concanavalin A-like lectin/glucanases superfamily/IPT/TIG domain
VKYRKLVTRLAFILSFLLPTIIFSNSYGSILSSPSLNLDGANTASLATSSPTYWNDLVSNGSTKLTIGSNSSYSSEFGGSLNVTSAGSSGASLAAGPTGTASNPSGAMTVMAWVKPTTFSPTWNIIASRWFSDYSGSGGAGVQDWHFSIKSAGNNATSPKLNLYTSGNSDIYGNYVFTTNNWYYVGFTLSGASNGTLQFYVNGRADGSPITGVSHTANTSAMLWVGDMRNTCTACSITGNLAKFRIWQTALSAPSILSDYQYETVGPPVITAISPNYGPQTGGTSLTISGTGFDSTTSVTVDGNAASITSNTSTLLQVTTPASATSGAKDVVVTTPAGSSTSIGGFIYGQVASNISLTLTAGNNPPKKLNSTTITASITTAGTVTFFYGNRPIHCLPLTIVSPGAAVTCVWKPVVSGSLYLTARLIPSSGAYSSSTSSPLFVTIGKRSTSR